VSWRDAERRGNVPFHDAVPPTGDRYRIQEVDHCGRAPARSPVEQPRGSQSRAGRLVTFRDGDRDGLSLPSSDLIEVIDEDRIDVETSWPVFHCARSVLGGSSEERRSVRRRAIRRRETAGSLPAMLPSMTARAIG
jgi:hypothetical protein